MAEEIRTTLQFDANIADFKGAMREASNAIKLTNSRFNAAASSMDDWSQSADGLQAKLQQLADIEAAEQRKLEILQESYARVVEEQGEASEGAIKLATEINNQQAAVNKTKKAIDRYSGQLEELEQSGSDAKSGLDKAGKAAKTAGKNAENSGEGWTIVKDVIADMAKNALSWAVEGFKELLTAGDSALAGLGARTGATSSEMSKYNKVMQSIYRNNYGEDYNDIADAMGTVVQTMGDMDDASLQKVTQNAIALRDTFDMDYQESIRAANSLIDQFGISSDSAFNLIAQGAQNGLNQNGDLLDVINEYAVQFKSAGYSADDMFNMLSNGTESGTWSVDKLGDAVKEFNIRASDGTAAEALNDYRKALGFSRKDVKKLKADMAEGGEAGQAAYNTILEALLAIDDPTKQYQAGVALFGTMWEDLGADAIAALMKTEGGISGTKNAMEDLSNTKYDTLGSALSGLGRVIKSDLIQPLVDKLVPVAKGIVTWLTNNMDTVAPIIVGIATAIGILAAAMAITGLIKGVTAAFALLNGTMLANPILLVIAAIAGLVAAFTYLWKNNEGFREFILSMWETIKNAFTTAKEWCAAALDAIASAFSLAWAWIELAWAGVSEWFSSIWAGIQAVFAEVGTWFSEKFSAAWTSITSIFAAAGVWASGVWASITAVFTSVGTWFREKFSAAWTSITSIFAAAGVWASGVWASITVVFTSVGTWFSEKFSAAWTNITSAFSNAATWASGVWANIKSGFANVATEAATIGSNIVTGLWNGINNMAAWIGEKIKGFGSGVLSGIKKFFGIESPSKLMRDEVGQYIGLGMAEGIERSRKAVAGAVRALGNATMGSLSVGVGQTAGGIAGGKQIIFNQTNNSPRALSRREIYRQTHNALSYAGGM